MTEEEPASGKKLNEEWSLDVRFEVMSVKVYRVWSCGL
jgi:hypothetical protein